MKKVAYIASECVPFIKTGGLADVVGTLPKIFDKNEYDVRVIMPNYLCIPNKYREKMQYITHFYMDIGYKNDYVGVMYLEYEGVKVYFIDNEYYFNGFTPYGDVKWDIEKFCYFSRQRFRSFHRSVSSRIYFTVMTGRQDLCLYISRLCLQEICSIQA